MSLMYTVIDDDVGERLKKMFRTDDDFIRVDPGQGIYSVKYALYGNKIRNMEIRKDDVWMVSYPRSGSNWAQEMIWCIGNDFNYKGSEAPIVKRWALLERSALMPSGEMSKKWDTIFGDSVKYAENQPSPRYIKTLLPWDLLPQQLHQKKPKVIFITRNPKDVCVSFFHLRKSVDKIRGSIEEFAELMLEDYSLATGPFWRNVLKFWEHRNDSNILFLTYEDMKKDQAAVIRRTAKFMGKAVTEEHVAGLCEHLKFSNMAANPAFGLEKNFNESTSEDPNAKFIRKGMVGDWRNYMSEELSNRFDVWIEENTRGTGLEYDTDFPDVDE